MKCGTSYPWRVREGAHLPLSYFPLFHGAKIDAVGSVIPQPIFIPPYGICGHIPPVVPLPPLPALTSIEVTIHSGSLSARLADPLSCIRSAPALPSITFKYSNATPVEDIPASRLWTDVDRWLTRLAMHVKTKRSLSLVLKPCQPGGNSKREECLPEFRKAGVNSM